MKNNLYLFLILWLFAACQSSDKPVNTTENTGATKQQNTTAPSLSAVPDEMAKHLEAVDDVDFVFYTYDFTVNTSGNDAKGSLSYFTRDAVTNFGNGCKALCRMDFKGNGNMLGSADIYYGNGCNYGIFTIKGQKYANQLSPNAANFFNTIIDKVSTK